MEIKWPAIHNYVYMYLLKNGHPTSCGAILMDQQRLMHRALSYLERIWRQSLELLKENMDKEFSKTLLYLVPPAGCS